MVNSKGTVVISTNNNPNYFYFAPFVERAWNSLGWDVLFMITSDVNENELNIKQSKVVSLPDIEGVRSETVAQAGRLYAANYFDEEVLLMTSDIDLLPLSDYWNPLKEDVTIYGHDLTDFGEYPMGYIAMNRQNWINKFNLTGDIKSDMSRDVNEIKTAFSDIWGERWGYDQQLALRRLKPHHDQFVFINRGKTVRGLAYGRIDRYDWEGTQNQEWIDAHCDAGQDHLRVVTKESFLSVYEKVYGKL